jgi:hypothetical protein
MKKPPELDEGLEAFERFQRAVKAVLSVPKTALPEKPHRKPQVPFTAMQNVTGLVEPPKRRRKPK